MTVTRDTNPTTTLIERIKHAASEGTLPDPALARALDGVDDPAAIQQAARALARAQRHRGPHAPTVEGYRPVRVGLTAVSTPGPIGRLLHASLVAAGMDPEIETGEYGSFTQILASASGPLFDGRDAVFLLLDDSWFLPASWDGSSVAELIAYIDDRTDHLCELIGSAAERGRAGLLVLHTVPLNGVLRDSVVAWRDRAALSRAWYRMNARLLELAERHPSVAVADLVFLLAEAPVSASDDRLRRYADLPYTDEALLLLAREWRRVLQAKAGLSRKVLALDLDNTLWGGVLGEVGPEGVEIGGLYPGNCYKLLQLVARRLRNQGVMLALASKNDEAPVLEVLSGHPEVLLRPDAFSARAVDWAPKAGNLRAMAAELGLSPGAFVFMDDSPFECGHVAAELPETAVVPAAGDPAAHARRLLTRGWFDVLDLTATDRSRPALYRARSERRRSELSFASSEDYLRDLDITALIRPVGTYEVQRVAQLAARTNQFNLTGVRFDQADTARMAADPDHHVVLSCSVTDRFGDEGLVSALWVDRDRDGGGGEVWRIRNLVMSCRVLGRGAELAMIGELARQAEEAGAAAVEGRHLPSGRNGLAADLWTRAGFAAGPVLEDGTRTYTCAPASARNTVPDWIRVNTRR